MSQVNKLKERILKNKFQGTELTSIFELIREFGCLSDIIGRDFEVRDKSNELVYTIRQKPMSIKQMNKILEEHHVLKRLDNERESAKLGNK